MDIRQPILNTMHQAPSPLSNAFFSPQNMNKIQNSIRSSIKSETGLNIDRQNDDDLSTIMRYIYITNSLNPGGRRNITGDAHESAHKRQGPGAGSNWSC